MADSAQPPTIELADDMARKTTKHKPDDPEGKPASKPPGKPPGKSGNPPPRTPDLAAKAWRMEFARRFREAREASGLTTRELARAMDVQLATIYFAEKKGVIPSVQALGRASAALGVDLEALVPDLPRLRARKSGPYRKPKVADRDTIGGRIARRRWAAGLTQHELASLFDPPIIQNRVSTVEGSDGEVDRDAVLKFAEILHVDPSTLDVRLVPQRVIRLVREGDAPDTRWVADTAVDYDRLVGVVGEGHADAGIPEERAGDLVAEATEKRMAVLFRGDADIRHDMADGVGDEWRELDVGDEG